MTTETETLEALHLWLAEKLPKLRESCTCFGRDRGAGAGTHAVCDGRGWVPNVSTDGLFEAMSRLGWMGELQGSPYLAQFRSGGDTAIEGHAEGTTPLEALCRAARKALEAAS